MSPPTSVYIITPIGIRNAASEMSMPVSPLTTAAPPSSSMAVTIMFVIRANTRKTRWAPPPYLALMISRNVWALGALRLSSIASMPKRRTCIDAPAAYQNGPLTPYW